MFHHWYQVWCSINNCVSNYDHCTISPKNMRSPKISNFFIDFFIISLLFKIADYATTCIMLIWKITEKLVPTQSDIIFYSSSIDIQLLFRWLTWNINSFFNIKQSWVPGGVGWWWWWRFLTEYIVTPSFNWD